MKIAGFTGTQIGMTDQQLKAVHNLLIIVSELHHGDCVGADEQAHLLAEDLLISIVIHPPKNESKRAFCKSSQIRESFDYLERNRHIVCESDFLIATPKEEEGQVLRSGTWATIRFAKKQGKKIFIVRPSGKIDSDI